MFLLYIVFECLVVFRTVGEFAVDDADEVDYALEAEFVVGCTVDVLVEHVFYSLLGEVETGDELVVALQGRLELQVHSCHHGIDAAAVHLGEAQSAFLQEQMAGMLGVVQVVGVVYDAFDVTFVVTHLHSGFKDVGHDFSSFV